MIDFGSRLQADDGLMNGERDPMAGAQAALVEFETPDIYKDVTVYGLTTQMENRRYMGARLGRAAGARHPWIAFPAQPPVDCTAARHPLRRPMPSLGV